MIAFFFALGYIAIGLACFFMGIPAGKAGLLMVLHMVFSGLMIFVTYNMVSANQGNGGGNGREG